MSSWANRHIPRKRDLSQIPEALRPTIVPRVERPEIIASETFQKKENELIYPIEPEWKAPTFASLFPSKQSNTAPVKKYNSVELIHNEKTYVFVILRNIQKASDNDLWLSAYHSIRQFYTNKIVIIDDNSSINTVNGRLTNTEIITSEYNGAGEILPYYYFNKNKWADVMIFIHDSMVLYRPFTENELDYECVFHWHFEEKDASVIKKTIAVLSSLTKSKELEEYVQIGKWRGCFGGAGIIDLSVVEMLEEKYKVTKLVGYTRTRKQREIVERILGVLLSFEKNVTSNFGDIIDYPEKFLATTLQLATHNITQKSYNTAIIKLWRGR
jgi:hypothetical protein